MDTKALLPLSGKRILLLGARNGSKSVDYIMTAVRNGAKSVCVALHPDSFPTIYKLLIQSHKRALRDHIRLVVIPGLGRPDEEQAGTSEEIARFILKSASKKSFCFDACVSFQENLIQLAADLSSIFHLPGCDPFGVAATINKQLFRKCMQEMGGSSTVIQQAAFASLNDFLAGKAPSQLYNFPVIVKPSEGIGSEGVFLVNSMDDLRDRLYAYENKEIQTKHYDDWLVEEYLQGIEVGVELIMSDGECRFSSVMEVTKTPAPVFQGTGRFFPTSLGGIIDEEVISECVRISKFMGLNNSVVDIDCKYIPGRGPVVIEINCRMGGHSVGLMHQQIFGIDLVLQHFLCGCGESASLGRLSNNRISTQSKQSTWYTRIVLSEMSGTLMGLDYKTFEASVRENLSLDLSSSLCQARLARENGFYVNSDLIPVILAFVVAKGRTRAEAEWNADLLQTSVSCFVNEHIDPTIKPKMNPVISLPSTEGVAFMKKIFLKANRGRYFTALLKANNSNCMVSSHCAPEWLLRDSENAIESSNTMISTN